MSTAFPGVTPSDPDSPRPTPAWLVDEPFLDDLGQGEDGARVDIGPLKNTLLSAAAVDANLEHRL